MEPTKTGDGLKRVIGIRGLAAAIINSTLGAGIYVLPAIVSIQLGGAGILGYLFCGGMLVVIMLCYVEIGSRINGSGGSYIYVEKVFGPFAGFIVNWLFFFGWGVLGSAALMNVVADSLSIFTPAFLNPLMRALLYLILLGLMALINVRGTKNGVKFSEYITIIKLLPLFAIIVFGLGYVKLHNLHWAHLPSVNTFGETVLVLFYAFAGFETSLGISGEIKDSRRTLPLGILLGAAIVFVFYVLIQTVAQGVLGPQIINFKDAPLAAVAQNIVGPMGATVLLVAAMISSLGNVGGDVMATPRLLFAGANDGLFPKFLAKIHPKFATPYLAVITYAALIFIFSVSGGFKQLAVLASGALLLVYLGVVLATIKLRIKKEQTTGKTFRITGGITIPIIATTAIIWLLAHLSRTEMLSTIIFIAIICVVYFVMKKLQKNKAIADIG